MKTAISQCLQQFSSKISKNVYHDQVLKKLKLQCHCKILQKAFVLASKNKFSKAAILHSLQQFSSKISKNDYHDQILKKLKLHCHCKIVPNALVKITLPLQNCAKRSF